MILGLSSDLRESWRTDVAGTEPTDRLFPNAVDLGDGSVIWTVGARWHALPGDDLEEPWVGRLAAGGALQWHLTAPVEGATARYTDVATLSDGDAIAVGAWDTAGGSGRALIRRHAAQDGAAVWTISATSDEPYSRAHAVAVTEDDVIVVAGTRSGVNGYGDLWIGRYDADGEPLDDTILAEPLTSHIPYAVELDASGDAVVCGIIIRASAVNAMVGRFALAAASPTVWLQRVESIGAGSTDCAALAIDDLGRVAIAGQRFHPDTNGDHLIGRLDVDGELLWDVGVAPTGGFRNDAARGIAIDESGDLVVVGWSQGEVADFDMWIARLRG